MLGEKACRNNADQCRTYRTARRRAGNPQTLPATRHRRNGRGTMHSEAIAVVEASKPYVEQKANKLFGDREKIMGRATSLLLGGSTAVRCSTRRGMSPTASLNFCNAAIALPCTSWWEPLGRRHPHPPTASTDESWQCLLARGMRLSLFLSSTAHASRPAPLTALGCPCAPLEQCSGVLAPTRQPLQLEI